MATNKERFGEDIIVTQFRIPKKVDEQLKKLSIEFNTNKHSLCMEFIIKGIKRKLKELE